MAELIFPPPGIAPDTFEFDRGQSRIHNLMIVLGVVIGIGLASISTFPFFWPIYLVGGVCQWFFVRKPSKLLSCILTLLAICGSTVWVLYASGINPSELFIRKHGG